MKPYKRERFDLAEMHNQDKKAYWEVLTSQEEIIKEFLESVLTDNRINKRILRLCFDTDYVDDIVITILSKSFDLKGSKEYWSRMGSDFWDPRQAVLDLIHYRGLACNYLLKIQNKRFGWGQSYLPLDLKEFAQEENVSLELIKKDWITLKEVIQENFEPIRKDWFKEVWDRQLLD